MLSKKEKMLVTLAYYQGACDNVKMHTPVEKHIILEEAVIKSTSKILEELGISMPNPFENKDLYDYMQEMEQITGILCKEDEYK